MRFAGHMKFVMKMIENDMQPDGTAINGHVPFARAATSRIVQNPDRTPQIDCNFRPLM